MNTDFIKGVVVPILTPIDAEERIHERKLREQVDYVIEGGVLGILAFGSNGEFYVIEEDEMERGLKIMVDQAAGRVPVYFGIGAISTRKCVRLAKMAEANGAAGISILQPMFLKPTEAELYLHFKTIAEAGSQNPRLFFVRRPAFCLPSAPKQQLLLPGPALFPPQQAEALNIGPYTIPHTVLPARVCPAPRSCRLHCRPPAQDRSHDPHA